MTVGSSPAGGAASPPRKAPHSVSLTSLRLCPGSTRSPEYLRMLPPLRVAVLLVAMCGGLVMGGA